MPKPRKLLLGPEGADHCYHVVSRFAGRDLVFGPEEKEQFRKLLLRQVRFSGLRCLAWCCMGNHFHLLLEVPAKDKALEGWTQEDLLQRLELLSEEAGTRKTLQELALWRQSGHAEAAARLAASVRDRLFDLSRFMHELKQKFSVWFNRRHHRRGTVWEERYRSVLVEGAGSSPDGPGGLLAVAAYIDLNAVRAGLVDDPKDYRWCSYAAAVAGDRTAREGLARCLQGPGSGNPAPETAGSWRRIGRAYRMLLYGAGEERSASAGPQGAATARRGFSREEVEAVWRAGGRLTLHEALRCRVRYFTDGMVLGSEEYVEGFFQLRRASFGPRRTAGPRRMRGAEWGPLRILRDLQKEPVSVAASRGTGPA